MSSWPRPSLLSHVLLITARRLSASPAFEVHCNAAHYNKNLMFARVIPLLHCWRSQWPNDGRSRVTAAYSRNPSHSSVSACFQPFQRAQAQGKALRSRPNPHKSHNAVLCCLLNAQVRQCILTYFMSAQQDRTKHQLTENTSCVKVRAQELAISLQSSFRRKACHVRALHQLIEEFP